MATRRLTRQDRHVIGRGLVEGLSYAEIGRRLGRSTSTVTREVMRNGGPAGYHPEQAHRATERRSRHAAAATRRARGTVDEPDDAARRAYEQRLTEALRVSGLASMPARILSYLLVTDSGGRTAAEVAAHLRISPASVSRAVAGLEELALLRRERDQRRERYVVDDGMWYESTLTSARTNALVGGVARQGAEVLGPGSPAAVRLAAIARFLDIVSDGLLGALERARQTADTERDSPERVRTPSE